MDDSNSILIRKIALRSPFTLKHLPFLGRFHRRVMRRRTTRKAQLLIGAPLEKAFRFYYRFVPLAATGELEYQTARGRQTIRFNARNLAFDILYADLFAENYEDETGVLLDAFVAEGTCLYDIGSNWGYFSLYVASRGENFKIHAFEPVPSTHRDLISCVKQAGLEKTVQCYCFAVSDSEGHVTFELPLHSASAQVGGKSQGVRVPTSAIDSLDIDPPNFIKIDAEGHEAAVLRGAEKTLRANKPFVMFENKIYRESPEQTLDPLRLLADLGFQLFVPSVVRRSGKTSYFLNCGYQIDTARMQPINEEDILALVPCELSRRFLLPPYLNIFACHQDRMEELNRKFIPLGKSLSSLD